MPGMARCSERNITAVAQVTRVMVEPHR
jgi:hypothetical protein